MWGISTIERNDEMLFKNHSNAHILCPHSAAPCPFFFFSTQPHNYFCPVNISSSCGELLWHSCGIRADLLGVVVTFGSSLTQPSSSMWTRVALRVTTPFPLHTLLGSKSENIRKKSHTSTAPHRSRHSGLIFTILMVHSCWESTLRLPHAPNNENRPETSKPGH